MEREPEQRRTDEPTNRTEGAPIAEVQTWIAAWPDQRHLLQRLIRERARVDPAYSWLGADRELQLMDDVLQRLSSIVTTLSKPAPKRGE